MRTWKELLHLLAASGMQACRFTERPLAEWPEYVRSDALRGCYWRIMNFQLLLRRVYPRRRRHERRDTLPTTFNPFRIPVALSTKGEDRTIARARQMLAEAQATWDNGTSCSYIRHNSPPHETSDVLTSEKIGELTWAKENSWGKTKFFLDIAANRRKTYN